jgi:hypothetical protein
MNPFLLNGYISPEYFCDRDNETKWIIDNLMNNANISIFAPRRIGKSVLIKHCFYHLKKEKYLCLYIDIYSTQNLNEFVNTLANSIYQELPVKKGIKEKFIEAIKSLRPVITFDEVNQLPQLHLDIVQHKKDNTILQLIEYVEKQKIKTIIAIDEFQQILKYPEKNIEEILRTTIQNVRHINFIFSGSNQNIMQHIFFDKKRPFYLSTKPLNLEKIPNDEYRRFIIKHFTKHRYKVKEDAINYILEITDQHTYYTQFLCHEIFVTKPKVINIESVNEVLVNILKQLEPYYYTIRNLLTPQQWDFLRILAKEKKLYKPYSNEFLSKHKEFTASNVKRILESLLEKELIIQVVNKDESYYEIEDKFLSLWLSKFS